MKLNYFNFKKIEDSILMTNDLGRFCFIPERDFKNLLSGTLDKNSESYSELLKNRMIYEETDLGFSENARYDLLEVKRAIASATTLHIFVVTTACNMNCIYCQANNGKHPSNLYMDTVTAERSVDIALQSPSKVLAFEFQGGEPLLNFETVKHIVEYAESNKKDKVIEYNIVTNLTLLTDEMLDFFENNNVGISTSLDGPIYLHNINRPFINGSGTYNTLLQSIEKVKKRGIKIGAIETTTKFSLPYPKEIVRTYADLGFTSVFIRPLTPLGKADKNWLNIGYKPADFIDFYKKAVDEVIQLNLEGRSFREDHAGIFMRKILGYSTNYMELRSPCGAGIGQIAYYADGNIFTCDEARMLFEMGNNSFLLGNVYSSSYRDLVMNKACSATCAASILETIPSCCDCVYQPYCGTCPVINYAQSEDLLEKHPREYKCLIYSGILDHIFSLLHNNNNEIIDILKSWSN